MCVHGILTVSQCLCTGLKKWVEVGNSGVFRPEMLLPMGLPENVSVIAWGLSLERSVFKLAFMWGGGGGGGGQNFKLKQQYVTLWATKECMDI